MVLTLTPHIVRMAEISEDEQHPIWVGTEHALHVSDEPPPYATPREGEAPAETIQPSTASPSGTREGAAPAAPGVAPETQTIPPSVPGEATLEIDPLDIRVPVGVQFSARISIRSTRAFASSAFDLTFDPDLLEVAKIEAGPSIHDGFTGETAPGRVAVRFNVPRDFDGTACNVIFTAKKPGSANLTVSNPRVTDPSGNAFPVTVQSSSVQISNDLSTHIQLERSDRRTS